MDADLGVIQLRPAVATAVIEVPIAGAMVYVDGRQRGRAPVRLDDICAGHREIEIRIQGRRFVDRRVWRAGDIVTLRADFRWAFMLLPTGASALSERALSRVETTLQDAQHVLVMTPRPTDLGVPTDTAALISIVTDDSRDVADRRAAGERLADALDAQGVVWVTGSPGDADDDFTLSLLARGSGAPETLRLQLARLGSLTTAIRLLSPGVPPVTRPSLGVSLVDVADIAGAAVVRAPAGSPGQSAALSVGDVVVGVDGVAVTSAGVVDRALAARKAGDAVRLDVRLASRNRAVTLRVSETPDLIPLTDANRLYNLLLPDMEEVVGVATTPLAESAARLNLAVVHIALQNWDGALRELDRVELSDGPGISAGTVSYLSALCLLELAQLTAAEEALRRAAAAEESVLFIGGPRVSSLARQRLRDLFDRRP